MKHAINELKMVLDTAENNEPIQRASGEVEQADLNREKISSIKKALVLLEAIEAGANCAIDPSFQQRRADMDANSGPEDDDLGELDPSAACKLDNPECESCS